MVNRASSIRTQKAKLVLERARMGRRENFCTHLAINMEDKADELLDESSMNSSGVEDFLASQGISSSPIRGGEKDGDSNSILEDASMESDNNTTANPNDINDLVAGDDDDDEGTQSTPINTSFDDDNEIEFNLEKGREPKPQIYRPNLKDPPSTVKKASRANTPSTPATVQSVNNILKDYGFSAIGHETEINSKVRGEEGEEKRSDKKSHVVPGHPV